MFASREGLVAAVFYGLTSTAIAFLNKALLSSYEFNYPCTLLLVQMLIGIAAVEAARLGKFVALPAYTFGSGMQLWVPSVCCAAQTVLSLLALEGMNIPMYAAIKRCTPLVNLVLAMVVLHKPCPSKSIVMSVLLITLGCLIAGLGDLMFNFVAYTFGAMSVVVQGMYHTLIQKAAESDYSTLEIFYLNCYNCFIMFLLTNVVTMEFKYVYHYPYLASPGFILLIFAVSSVGAVLNYSLFLCTSLNSALTTSVVGVLKSILQVAIGFFTFGGVAFNLLNILGLTLNTAGGILYTCGKLKETPNCKNQCKDGNITGP